MTPAVISGKGKFKNGPKVCTEIISSSLRLKPWMGIHMMSGTKKAISSSRLTPISRVSSIPNLAKSQSQMSGSKKCHGVLSFSMRPNGYPPKRANKFVIQSLLMLKSDWQPPLCVKIKTSSRSFIWSALNFMLEAGKSLSNKAFSPIQNALKSEQVWHPLSDNFIDRLAKKKALFESSVNNSCTKQIRTRSRPWCTFWTTTNLWMIALLCSVTESGWLNF